MGDTTTGFLEREPSNTTAGHTSWYLCRICFRGFQRIDDKISHEKQCYSESDVEDERSGAKYQNSMDSRLAKSSTGSLSDCSTDSGSDIEADQVSNPGLLLLSASPIQGPETVQENSNRGTYRSNHFSGGRVQYQSAVTRQQQLQHQKIDEIPSELIHSPTAISQMPFSHTKFKLQSDSAPVTKETANDDQDSGSILKMNSDNATSKSQTNPSITHPLMSPSAQKSRTRHFFLKYGKSNASVSSSDITLQSASTSTTIASLGNHNKINKSPKCFKCQLCEITYSTLAHLIEHKMKHHNYTNQNAQFSRSRSITDNKTLQARPKRTPPGNFHKLHDYVTALDTRVGKNSNKTKMQCSFCDKKFVRNDMFLLHENQHKGILPYACPYCQKCFASNGYLCQHMANSRCGLLNLGHSGEPHSVSSSSGFNLTNHMEGNGTTGRDHHANFIQTVETGSGSGLVYYNQNSFLVHQNVRRTSSGIIAQRSYLPNLSPAEAEARHRDRGDKNKDCGLLNRHSLESSITSNPDDPLAGESSSNHPQLSPEIDQKIINNKVCYICNLCGKRYARREHARYHIRSHTGDRPFKCSYPKCNESFGAKRYLSVHMKKHTRANHRSALSASRAYSRTTANTYLNPAEKRLARVNVGVATESGAERQATSAATFHPRSTTTTSNNTMNSNSILNPKSEGFFCQFCGQQYKLKKWLDKHNQKCGSVVASTSNSNSTADEQPGSYTNEILSSTMIVANPDAESNLELVAVNRSRQASVVNSDSATPNHTYGSDPLFDSDDGDGDGESIVVLSSEEDDENIADGTEQSKGTTCYVYAHGRICDFWDSTLNNVVERRMVAPVSCFKMAPLSGKWDGIAKVGHGVELKNPLFKEGRTNDMFWMGTVQDIRGYRILINFETFETRRNCDEHKMWVSFLNKDVKPLFWCDHEKLDVESEPFVRAKALEKIDNNKYRAFYAKPTVNMEIYFTEFLNEVHNTWTLNENCEALDIVSPHQNRLAYVKEIKGNRILITYYVSSNSEEVSDGYDDGFWCHFQSDHIHKIGWSRKVGMELNGGDYKLAPDATMVTLGRPENIEIQEGMLLEVRHPKLTNKIVGAKIIRVLDHGYFIIETKEREILNKATTRIKFVFHVTSPFIFPLGFANEHGLPVDSDVENEYGQVPYLKLDKLPARAQHDFRVGHRLEASMISKPELIRPATIKTIAGHLLLLHFDGRSTSMNENYQWVDSESSELYPVGFSESFGFELQGNARIFVPSIYQRAHPLPLAFSLSEYI